LIKVEIASVGVLPAVLGHKRRSLRKEKKKD
jgi:hypothetical protein